MLFPDGHKERVDLGGSSLLQDRNGNQITFNANGFTDPTGRSVQVSAWNGPSTITYQGGDNIKRQITISYANLSTLAPGGALTYAQLFPALYPNTVGIYNPSVPSSVGLPDGSSYQFTYTPYGEVASIKLPSGGRIVYDYPSSVGQDCTTSCALTTTDGNGYINGGVIIRRVLDRKEFADSQGSALSHQTVYSPNYNGNDANGPTVITVTEEDGSGTVLQVQKHHYLGSFVGDATLEVRPWEDGRETLTEFLGGAGNVIRQQLQTWVQSSVTGDPQVCQEFTILTDATPSLSAATLMAYDRYNNVTDRYEYDYGAGPGPNSTCQAVTGGWTRHTQTSYLAAGYDSYQVGTASPDATTAGRSVYQTSLGDGPTGAGWAERESSGRAKRL